MFRMNERKSSLQGATRSETWLTPKVVWRFVPLERHKPLRGIRDVLTFCVKEKLSSVCVNVWATGSKVSDRDLRSVAPPDKPFDSAQGGGCPYMACAGFGDFLLLVNQSSGQGRTQHTGVRRNGIRDPAFAGPAREVERSGGVDAVNADVLVSKWRLRLADLGEHRGLA